MLLQRLWLQRKTCPNCGSTDTEFVQRKKLVMELRRCRLCKLKFRYPKDSVTRNKSFYQLSYSDGPQAHVPATNEIESMLECGFEGTPLDLSRSIKYLKAELASGRVLDFGCSWGYGVIQLKNAGYNAFGYEVSRPRAAFGRRLGLEIKDSFDELDSLPAGTVDAIFSSHVFEHLPEIGSVIRTCTKLLRTGGKLLVLVPNGDGEDARSLGVKWLSLIGENHTLALDSHFFNNVLEKYGFDVKFSSNFGDGRFFKHNEIEANWSSMKGEELVVLGTKV